MKTGVSSGQEKERCEQTMNASDMWRDLGDGARARRGAPEVDRGNDGDGHAGGAHRATPGPIGLRYHPEMSSSPATSVSLNHDRCALHHNTGAGRGGGGDHSGQPGRRARLA
ncbi:hypothetical protein Sru01_08410 [Sphaerisporangium rufum]|uniref:Uncharacterized protein n=1 Tax=Sphaerisporangium rufum TaxID=1381558 RepID=A0A919QXE8_9ACTN|nr:hypothetical protein Sru01_08410 [Sphaerisporangium rufum]